MLKIAHRGNTNGPSIHENQVWYIQEALDKGFDAEIDIWMIRDKLWLGHNSAQYLVDLDFLLYNKSHLWIHCKNFEALQYFASQGLLFNYFWHQEDDFTLTSWNWIWTYPGKVTGDFSIIVDLDGNKEHDSYGICSDYFIDNQSN